jgi:hypothetical protein
MSPLLDTLTPPEIDDQDGYDPDEDDRLTIIELFIQELRSGADVYPLRSDKLTETAKTYDVILSVIPAERLDERQNNSLFAECQRLGALSSRQILSVWEASIGHQLRTQSAEQARAEQAAKETSLPEEDPERQRLLTFLSKRGVDIDAL